VNIDMEIALPAEQFKATFPFHLAISPDLKILQVGKALQRLAPETRRGQQLSDHFSIVLPENAEINYAWLCDNRTSFVLLKHKDSALQLRGGVVMVPEKGTLLLLLSPWLTNTEQLDTLGIELKDFAVHDPMTDLLMVLQFNKQALEDSTHLSWKLQVSKEGLDKANSQLSLRNIVAKQLATAVDARGVITCLMEPVCKALGWQSAGWWELRGKELCFVAGWGAPECNVQPMLDESQKTTFEIGAGLPGRAWANLKPEWIEDVTNDPDFPRKQAASEAGLCSGMAFPICRGGQTWAVMEFFSSVTEKVDEMLLTTFSLIVGQIEQALAKLDGQDRLRESQKLDAIGQLTGGLAHDFNNLLGIVVGNLDLVEETLPLSEHAAHKSLIIAREAALRGAKVTRSLLAVARRQPLELACHDINTLVAEMLPLVVSSVGSESSLRVHISPHPLRARLDAAGLANVMLNLAINARDAMENMSGESVLTLTTRREIIRPALNETLSSGSYAVLEVADNGSGMTDMVLTQAFEPFFTTKERGEGTGLGLAMVHGYAEQLGGTARIISSSTGTRVQVFLPLEVEMTAVRHQVSAVSEIREQVCTN
jgi:signal transduction histidine kinase